MNLLLPLKPGLGRRGMGMFSDIISTPLDEPGPLMFMLGHSNRPRVSSEVINKTLGNLLRTLARAKPRQSDQAPFVKQIIYQELNLIQ